MFTTSPLHDGSLLHVASHKLLSRAVAEASLRLRPLDTDAEEVSALALQCLSHLFTWVPLSAHIGARLLNIVFQFAALGAQVLVRIVVKSLTCVAITSHCSRAVTVRCPSPAA
jgi:hypothetical protein